MNGDGYPDRLQLTKSGRGELVAVGIPFAAKVYVQEYYSRGVPHYALVNLTDDPLTLSLRTWNGAPGSALLDPWRVPTHAAVVVPLGALAPSELGSLLALTKDGGALLGLLRAPGTVPSVDASFRDDAPITAEGLNGVGDHKEGITCVQEKLAYAPGDRVTLRLSVPGRVGTLVFPRDDSFAGLPALAQLGVASDTASVTSDADAIRVSPGADRGEVTIEGIVPSATDALAVILRVQTVAKTAGGSAHVRAFLVGEPSTPTATVV